MRAILTGVMVFCVLLTGAARGDLVHRYDFTSNVNDQVGSAHGVLVDPQGISYFDGSGALVLGNSGIEFSADDPIIGAYVDLPDGIISALGPDATFELWTTYYGNFVWEELFSFGVSSSGIPDRSDGGGNYVMCSPQDGGGVLRWEDFPGGYFVVDTGVLSRNVEHSVILAFNGTAGTMTAYRDGEFIGSASVGTSLPTLNDVNNWLGRSQWNDRLYEGGYSEVRLYNEARTEYEVLADTLAGPDATPADPVYPTDSFQSASLSPTLEWSAPLVLPGAVTGYDVYFYSSEERDPNFVWTTDTPTDTVGAGTTTWSPPGPLNSATLHHWRVDTEVGAETIKGPVWTFRTLALTPELTGPAGVLVAAGDPAEFTAVISSVSSVVGCTWYKVDAGGDIELDPGLAKYDVTCSDTATALTVNDAALADEGQYYVVVENADGTTQSDAAWLSLERLIGQWPFDGNVMDVVEGNDGTVLDGTADYVAGIVGSQAVDFTDLDYRITVPTDAYVVDDAGFTVTWWEWADPNMSGVSWTYEAMLATGPVVGNEGFQFNRFQGSGYDLIIGGSPVSQPGGTAPRGSWYFHAVTYDRPTRQATWYRDGREIFTWTTANSAALDTVIYVGDERPPGTMEFKGYIDDLDFYNYPLGRYDVAAAYHAIRPGDAFCVENPTYDISGPAGVPDCVVNLFDLAALGSEWLLSNVYPQ